MSVLGTALAFMAAAARWNPLEAKDARIAELETELAEVKTEAAKMLADAVRLIEAAQRRSLDLEFRLAAHEGFREEAYRRPCCVPSRQDAFLAQVAALDRVMRIRSPTGDSPA